MYYFLFAICWVLQKLLMPVRIVNKKNLIKGKAILCCNHQSNLDFLPICLSARTKIYVLCKIELFKNKFISWFLKKLHAIGINRKKPEISSIKKCLTVLNDEANLLVFPSGTRTSTEDVENLKNGVALFSLKTKAPLVPMVYLKKNRIFRRNTLVVGDPIYVDDMEYSKENCEKLIQILEEKMNNLIQKGKKK